MPTLLDDDVTFHYRDLAITDLLHFLAICRIVEPGNLTWSTRRLGVAVFGEPDHPVTDSETPNETKSEHSSTSRENSKEEAAARNLIKKVEKVLILNSDRINDGTDKSTSNLSLFIKDKNNHIKGLSPHGWRFRKIVEKYEAILKETSQEQRTVLRLSIAEALATYVMPEILWERHTNEMDDERVAVQLERSDLSFLEEGGALVRGDVDAVVVWNPEMRKWKGTVCPSHRIMPIKSSQARLCLVFHASHEFAGWLKKQRKALNQHSDGSNLSKDQLLSGLNNHSLYYPGELFAIRDLVMKLVRNDKSRMFRTEGFPAVVAQVRTGIAIGIFPHWPAVLHRLKVEEHIYYQLLPPDFDESVSLVAYHREDHTVRTQQAKELIGAISFAFLDAREPDHTAIWQPQTSELGFADPSSIRSQWGVYYLNRSSGEMPFPKWRRGSWKWTVTSELLAVAQQGQIRVENQGVRTGVYTMTKTTKNEETTITFDILGELTNHSLHVISTPRPDQAIEQRNPTTITFVQWFKQKSSEANQGLLFGFIHTSHNNTTSVAPFILCPPEMELGLKDLRAICGQVEFHTRANKL